MEFEEDARKKDSTMPFKGLQGPVSIINNGQADEMVSLGSFFLIR